MRLSSDVKDFLKGTVSRCLILVREHTLSIATTESKNTYPQNTC